MSASKHNTNIVYCVAPVLYIYATALPHTYLFTTYHLVSFLGKISQNPQIVNIVFLGMQGTLLYIIIVGGIFTLLGLHHVLNL